MSSTLVVVDMQRIFQDPGSQWVCPGYDAAAERVAALTEEFAGNIVWTRFVRDPLEHGSWRDYYACWDRCREPEGSAVWELTLPATETDAVLTMPTFSKWGAELAELTRDSDRLIVCGVATDCCVISTVLGAVDAGKHVSVVVDACAGATDEAHEQAIALMGMLSPMVELTTTSELVRQ